MRNRGSGEKESFIITRLKGEGMTERTLLVEIQCRTFATVDIFQCTITNQQRSEAESTSSYFAVIAFF